jgi:hypothetical protein
MNSVYALASCSITNDGGETFRLYRGEPWDADDPLVKSRPQFFSKKPVVVRTSMNPGFAEYVEQATAAPGEKRALK